MPWRFGEAEPGCDKPHCASGGRYALASEDIQRMNSKDERGLLEFMLRRRRYALVLQEIVERSVPLVPMDGYFP